MILWHSCEPGWAATSRRRPVTSAGTARACEVEGGAIKAVKLYEDGQLYIDIDRSDGEGVAVQSALDLETRYAVTLEYTNERGVHVVYTAVFDEDIGDIDLYPDNGDNAERFCDALVGRRGSTKLQRGDAHGNGFGRPGYPADRGLTGSPVPSPPIGRVRRIPGGTVAGGLKASSGRPDRARQGAPSPASGCQRLRSRGRDATRASPTMVRRHVTRSPRSRLSLVRASSERRVNVAPVAAAVRRRSIGRVYGVPRNRSLLRKVHAALWSTVWSGERVNSANT